MVKLNQNTIDNLKSYVYILKDPSNGEIFYVGKGKGDRINSHGLEAQEGDKMSKKVERIREITASGRESELIIQRHGLKSKQAFEIESAVIDLLKSNGTLTNQIDGHDSDEFGMMTVKDLELKYQAEPAPEIFKHSAILITVNKLFQECKSPEDLYNRTRSAWRMGIDRAKQIEIVCAVYHGIIREVYVPELWSVCFENNGRIYFEGKVADDLIRELYIDKSVKSRIKVGSSNPIRYIWENQKSKVTTDNILESKI